MDGQHVFVWSRSLLIIQTMAASEITPQKVSRFHEILHRYKLIHHYIYSNQVKSICFQQVHWRSVVWRTCRHSRQVTSIALWQPRQRRQETAVNDIWMTFFARIPAAFSCNLETCQRLMQLAHLFASQKVCLSFADAFPARRRWTSPPHQGKGWQPKWRSRLIWAQLLRLIERAMAEILWNFHISHSATLAEWLSGCSSHSGSDCGRMAEWLSGRVAEWLLQPLWQSGYVAECLLGRVAEWLSGCVSHSGRVPEWLSGCSSHSGRVAEWLHQPLWQSGWVAEWLRQSHQSMKWIKFLNVSISKQDFMTLTATWFTKITL